MNTIQLAKKITDMVQNGDYVAGHTILDGRDTSKNIPNQILEKD